MSLFLIRSQRWVEVSLPDMRGIGNENKESPPKIIYHCQSVENTWGNIRALLFFYCFFMQVPRESITSTACLCIWKFVPRRNGKVAQAKKTFYSCPYHSKLEISGKALREILNISLETEGSRGSIWSLSSVFPRIQLSLGFFLEDRFPQLVKSLIK